MKHILTLVTALLLVSLVCLSSAHAQQIKNPATADEAKAIADGINHPVEPDPRVQSDGKPWGINQATVTDATRPRVLLIGDSLLNGYANTVIKRLSGKVYVDYWVTPACQSEGFNKMLAMVWKNGPYDVIHIIKHLDLKQNDFHWKDGAKKLQGEAVADCVLKLLPARK
jgi:hypothetical protein